MKPHILPALAATLLMSLPAHAGEQTARIDVGEMTCPTCSYTVASAIRRLPTTEIVEFKESATFGEGVFVVTFDDAAATPEMIVEAVTANGYPARVLPEGNS
ncbi:heavy-metal-associated domain-containing protein [Albidovulum sp.]